MKYSPDTFLLSLVLALMCAVLLSSEWATAQGSAMHSGPSARQHTANQAPHAQATTPRPTLDPTRMPLARLPLATLRAELTATAEPAITPTIARPAPTPTSTPAPATSRQPHFQQYVPRAGQAANHTADDWLPALAILLLFGGGCLALASKRYNT